MLCLFSPALTHLLIHIVALTSMRGVTHDEALAGPATGYNTDTILFSDNLTRLGLFFEQVLSPPSHMYQASESPTSVLHLMVLETAKLLKRYYKHADSLLSDSGTAALRG
ncbi:hypothetical protein H4582DRAFT_170059 [Lactarius indigo]|nr:hypothetical protein H4582DRAFT_170059 [Lactarius indigo]